MSTIYTLKNEHLEIQVKKTGAEICSIKNLSNNKEYMWNADPSVWAGSAPILFPIVGALKDSFYYYKSKKYSLPQHGFVRKNAKVILESGTPDSLVFLIRSDEASLKSYPFQFELRISFTLLQNEIIINHQVNNLSKETMYFSVGGHPAFKCPLEKDEKYSDYYLEFELPETAYTYSVKEGGLIGPAGELVLNESRKINLHYDLFAVDALVFKDLKSSTIQLVSKKSGKRIRVDYTGFPYLGIWAKPNANYVCIEPWLGIADSIDSTQQIIEKEGIIPLASGKTFEASYSVCILN